MVDKLGDLAGGDPAPDPDRHGQAALLLVESLIHSLVERSTLTAEEAIDVVDIAAEIEREMFERPGTRFRSLLSPIAISIGFDTKR